MGCAICHSLVPRRVCEKQIPMNDVCKSRQRNTFRLEMRNDPLILLSMNQTLRHKDLNIYSLGSPKFRRHQAGLPHGIGPQGTLFDDNDNAIPYDSIWFSMEMFHEIPSAWQVVPKMLPLLALLFAVDALGCEWKPKRKPMHCWKIVASSWPEALAEEVGTSGTLALVLKLCRCCDTMWHLNFEWNEPYHGPMHRNCLMALWYPDISRYPSMWVVKCR